MTGSSFWWLPKVSCLKHVCSLLLTVRSQPKASIITAHYAADPQGHVMQFRRVAATSSSPWARLEDQAFEGTRYVY